RVLELAAQTGVLAIELLDLPGRRIRLRPPSLWAQRHAIGRIHLLAPAREHRGINALAAQERAEGAGLLATVGLGEQRTLLAGRELAAPGGRDNLRVGCRRGPGHPSLPPPAPPRDPPGGNWGAPGGAATPGVGARRGLGHPSLALRAPSGMPRAEAGEVLFIEEW